MTRRHNDPEDLDVSQFRNGNGWSLPSLARVGIVGVLCFLLLFLVGAIPYLPSPVLAIQDKLREHNDTNGVLLKAICRELAGQASRPHPSECR